MIKEDLVYYHAKHIRDQRTSADHAKLTILYTIAVLEELIEKENNTAALLDNLIKEKVAFLKSLKKT